MLIDKKLKAKITQNYAHGDWTLIGQNLGISSAAVRQAVAAGNGSLRVVTELENFTTSASALRKLRKKLKKDYRNVYLKLKTNKHQYEKTTSKSRPGVQHSTISTICNQSKNNQHRLYAVRRFRLRSYTG